MKSIRIWFKKINTAKYISHLDLCRCMERAIHKAKLPFWYTEGYNPHVFLTITMPISLGYTGKRESMDVKLLNDDFPKEKIIEGLNAGLPQDIVVFDVTDVIMKPGELAFSLYEIQLDLFDGLQAAAEKLLALPEILVVKKTKKGVRQVDIKPDFSSMVIKKEGESLIFNVTLPSSNLGSINPRLFFDRLSEEIGEKLYPQTIRIDCYNQSMEQFC